MDGWKGKKGRKANLQNTQRKNHCNSRLLHTWDIQTIHGDHRQSEDDNIGRDVKAGVGVPEVSVIDAVARHGVVEGLGDGRALEDSGHDHSNAEHSNAGQDEHAAPAEPANPVEDPVEE